MAKRFPGQKERDVASNSPSGFRVAVEADSVTWNMAWNQLAREGLDGGDRVEAR